MVFRQLLFLSFLYFFIFLGKPAIRVDDPNSIIFTGKIVKDICRFCSQAESKFKCSKCVKAKYCSKECQTYDWKLLKHKLVCYELDS
jgi:hypothetical protein